MPSLVRAIRDRARPSNRTVNRGRNRISNPNLGLPAKHPLAYTTWRSMTNRCYNENNTRYKDYGAKGITVCDRWRNFSLFLKDMGDPPVVFGYRMTIDRKDNTGNYTPENCKWSTGSEQRDNQSPRPRII